MIASKAFRNCVGLDYFYKKYKMKKTVLGGAAMIFSLVFMHGMADGKETREAKAARIHQSVLTIDTHSDTPLNLLRDGFDVGKRNDMAASGTKCDFPRMKEGGLDAQFFAVFVAQGPRTPEGDAAVKKKALEIYAAIRKSVAENSGQAEIALTPDDAYRLKKLGKRAIFISKFKWPSQFQWPNRI